MASRSKFPRGKPDVMALAQAMVNGFTVDTTDYPAPPVNAAALQARIDAFIEKRNARITADAAAKEALDEENEAFEALVDDMKTDLEYAEMVTDDDDTKLQEIGWSGRAEPTAMPAPNAPRALEIIGQGKGWANFDWKEPLGKNGGTVSMYRLLMMEVGGTGDWREVASNVESDANVTGLESNKEYLFCVVAVNKAGVSGQSNSVTAFL